MTACPGRLPLVLAAMLGVFAMPGRAAAQKNFDQPPQIGRGIPGGTAAARNPRFTLINDSAQIIDTLNISPVRDEAWGDDLLGTLAIPPHSRIIAGPTQDTGCTFDVRVVYHDRREEILRRQNLCNLQEISVTGRNAQQQRARTPSGDD